MAVELDFDLRSRGRRLVPELCGAVGMSAAVACIVLAAGETAELAVALWLVVAGRAVASIPFARTQIERLHERPVRLLTSDLAQLAGVVLAVVATVLDTSVLAGLIVLGVLAAVQLPAGAAPTGAGRRARRRSEHRRARARGRDGSGRDGVRRPTVGYPQPRP